MTLDPNLSFPKAARNLQTRSSVPGVGTQLTANTMMILDPTLSFPKAARNLQTRSRVPGVGTPINSNI